MKRTTIFSLLILLVLFAKFAFAQKGPAVELPMKFRGSMPAVEVMVNGKGPFLFAIDTGAAGLARVDSSLVEKLGLKINGEVQAGDGSGSNMRALKTVEVASLKVGDIEFTKMTVITRDYNTSPGIPRIDGILGFDLFADYLLTLDYPGKIVRIEKGELPKANAENILAFDNSRVIPIVELQVGGQKIKAHIDSGNMVGGFILPAAVVEKSRLAAEPVVVGKARTVANEIEIKQVRLKDDIRLGSFVFAEPTVNFPALSDANIGSRILREFSLTFDQKNKLLKLARTGTPEEPRPVAGKENIDTKDYVGKFGDRTISSEGGSLFIQRPNGMKLKLVNLAKDEFTLEQVLAARIKFVRDEQGKVSEIQVLNQAGVWEKAKKDPV